MKNFITYITVSAILLLAFSCNDDFLYDGQENSGNVSSIVISPDWETQDYRVYCEGAGVARFTVVHAPSWLDISSTSELFIGDIAYLTCKAKPYGNFSETGIHHSSITLSIDGKGKQIIPVLYIVEGNPVISTVNRLNIDYDNYYNMYYGRLTVRNAGNGILIWTVAEHPKWLTLNTQNDKTVFILPSNGEETIINA